MTTPATVGGKAFLIAYGLFGCAGTILFFNLFLERIISLLAFIMRACRERQLRRSGLLPATFRRGSALSEADSLAGWKPSVYHVLLILGLFAVLLACCASAMYTSVEGWDYVDSLYFCFVTFSTIGFGDLVSSQHAAYRNQGLYRLGNFLFILLGVCCIYSLFNVISILIKQVLNWMLRKLSCRCCTRCCPAPGAPLARRNAITPGSRLRRRLAAMGADPATRDSDAEGRRLSGELISMRDLTASNKVSLALLQKQLSETANGYPRSVCVNTRQNGFSGGVGALGIMNNRLAETSASRKRKKHKSLSVSRRPCQPAAQGPSVSRRGAGLVRVSLGLLGDPGGSSCRAGKGRICGSHSWPHVGSVAQTCGLDSCDPGEALVPAGTLPVTSLNAEQSQPHCELRRSDGLSAPT
ncbi:potassium channel subfamily K member 12 [Cricetulus griseus]